MYYGRKGIRYGQGRDNLHDRHRKQAFGLRSSDKWPAKGMPSRQLKANGFMVAHHVLSVEEAKNTGSTRRCYAECPKCAKWVCAGHLGQHLEACKG